MEQMRHSYDSKGKLRSMYYVDEFNNNHGTTVIYDPVNENIREIIEFNHGIIDGKRTLYTPDGSLWVKELWKYGRLVSHINHI